MLALLLFALVQPAHATDPQVLVAAITEYNATAVMPIPIPQGGNMETLAAGELIRIREVVGPDEPQRAIGLQVMPFTKEQLWVATGDDHYSDVDGLIYVKLGERGGQHPGNRWYQFLDVPRPFADRHWVIDSTDNLDLVQATDGRMWEQSWNLVDNGPALALEAVQSGRATGVTVEMAEKAIYTPVNKGAWLAITLPDGSTLFGYHVTSVVGGSIPDEFVASYTIRTLRKVFSNAAERVPELVAHYDEAHDPVIGGDHRPIRPFVSSTAVSPRRPSSP